MTFALIVLWKPLPMNYFVAQSYCEKISFDRGLHVEECMSNKELIKDRLERIENKNLERITLSDSASLDRLSLWNASWHAFLDYPLLGKSNWETNKGNYPHNLVLEAFQNLGILGGIGLIALLSVGIYRAWQCLRSGKGFLVPMLFIQSIVASQFFGSLYASAPLWMTLALLLIAKADRE